MIFFLASLISALAIGGALAVGGGGGGGGSGGGAVVSGGGSSTSDWDSTIDSAKIASYQTDEYNKQWGLNNIKAAQAYSLLERNGKAVAGDDVLIAISDTGIRSTHQEISSNYDAADSSSNIFYNPHGTHVGSTAAGVNDGNNMHGVAFNAKLMSVQVSLGFDIGDMRPDESIQYAVLKGAKVINMSWGSTFYTEIGSDSYNEKKLAYASDYSAAVSGDIFMAIAAGNDGENNSTHINNPAIFAQDSITNGQMIAVGAVDKNNNIAYYSNRCSQAKSNCLVAPGGSGFSGTGNNIYAAVSTSDTSYDELAGTSMATPHVAGAAAVIRGAWPYLTAKQTATILLDTATDLGDAGVDDVYGHGLLNLENAVQAQGANNVAANSLVFGSGSDAKLSSFTTNAIFGDAYSKNLSPILKNAVFFDKYGRDYKANLDQKIVSSNNNLYNLDNLLFNNYSSSSLPVSFGENYSNNLVVRFNTSNIFSDPTSGEIKHNKFGIKHLVVDKSTEDQSGFNATDISFSYSKNFASGLKIGFNKNDFTNNYSFDNPAQNYNLISYNNFASSPYRNLNLNSSAIDSENQINTNQLNISQNITSNLTTNLSYTSYNQSSSINKFSSDESRIIETNLGYKLNDKTKLGFNFGNLKELNNNFLGSQANGAFSNGSNPQTKYFGLNFTRNLVDNWQLTTSYSEGKTNVSGNNLGVFRDFNDIRSRGFAVGLLNDNFLNGKVSFVYSEPLRVYKGSTNVDIPISRDFDGNVQRLTANNVSLVPDGKERDLEFSYSFNVGKLNAVVNFNSIIRQEANNIKDSKDQYIWMVKYNLKF